jgi:hypothetical protein
MNNFYGKNVLNKMLQSVFKELYDQGILIFLDTDNYVTNNTDIDVAVFADREKFLQVYTEPVEQGWIFGYTLSIDEVLKTIKEDTCCIVEFGFNSDTEQKALEVGRELISVLSSFKFMAHWDERALKEHKVSTVITIEDLPQSIQDLIEEYDVDEG